jgi:hemin uptake protein HemP
MARELPPANVDAATPPVAESPTGGSPNSDLPRVVSSDSLLAGASRLVILHKHTIYFLRETRFGKLILTK